MHVHLTHQGLANDIQRNLIGPLEEIKSRYLPDRAKEIRVGLRTGDTSQSERQRMLRKPPHILITTPESLPSPSLPNDSSRSSVKSSS